ncbi:DUF2110 family protein [Candidatus Bathyarchaeota archaeon]|nr:DUF2110 family protein [Candidatus Bathyarchaeota archaeon]
MKLILSEKLDSQLRQESLMEFEREAKSILGDLRVQVETIGEIGGWVSIEYDGEDSEVFTEALKNRYGAAPIQFSRLRLGDVYRGFVVGSGKVGYGLYIDIGVITPSRKDGLYPLHRMRAQLIDGESRPLREIARRFCLYEGLPLDVRVESLEADGRISLALTERQEAFFKGWETYPFDRVVVVGALAGGVRAAIRNTGLERDIVNVERLSLASSILTCKLGTEALGVISKLGPELAGARLYPFIPRIRMKM